MTALPDMMSIQWLPYHSVHAVSMDVWIFVSMVFYAWVVQRNVRKIGSLCRHLSGFRDLARNKNPEGTKNPRRFWNFSFLALSVVNVSWFLYMLWIHAGWRFPFGGSHDTHTGCNYLLSVCAVYAVAFYLVKGLVVPVFAHVFDESRFGVFIWRMGLSYDFLLSVFTFPCLMVSLYADGFLQAVFFWTTVVLFSLFFVVKVLKAVIVGRCYSRFSYLHIFIYFCALEILLALSLWQIVFGL